ncbi:hypothetical protein BX257_4029 [Streptomyces sp. 3212.3]|uniref:hypothetical protein n=1 Tax=Streptomyces sp. 3212.3 TaxID=1938846 RepID=UPI000E284157|nr:hypothetical protein [Streptomyces sp. 3212.3]REE61451.1 hypothetical protein BX257_4029 [Streptomyces sp. 3212.3]
MADTLATLAAKIANLERLVRDLSRTSRLANSSIENGSIAVYDDGGLLRGSIGLQQDGTVALAAVNGPPPPVPATPALTSVLGGVAVTWDGTFAGGGQAPADFAYVQVSFSTNADFPDGGSLFAAFYSAQGSTMTVPTSVPLWVRLECVSTSGIVSGPSAVVGPVGPTPVVAEEVLDGIVKELSLADGAVTRAKIEAGAVDGTAIADGSISTPKLVAGEIDGLVLTVGTVNADRLVAASITAAQIAALGITGDRLAVNTVTADRLAAGTITAASGVISSIDASVISVGKIKASQIDATNLVIAAANVGAGQIPPTTTINGASILTGTMDAAAIKAGTISVDRLTAGLAGQVGQKWYDFGDSASKWLNSASASGTMTTVAVPDAQSGGNVMRCAGFVQAAYRPDVKIPFDPSVTYRVSIRVRQTVANSTPGTNQNLYAGVAGLAADGVTFVNNTGANSLSSQFYAAADGQPVTVGAGWMTFTGYIKGTSTSPVRQETPKANAPGQLHSNVRYITPILYANYQGGSGTLELDMFAIEVVEAGGITASNIKAGAIDGQTITGAVLRSVRPDGSVAALMAPDVGDGEAGFRTTSADGKTYAQLGSGEVTFGAAGINQELPTGITGTASGGTLDIQSGMIQGGAQAHIILASGDSPLAPGNGAPSISLEWDGSSGPGNADMVVDIGGVLAPRNFVWGRVTINVTTANSPASVTVTGLTVRGASFQALATALSSAIGTVVTGVGVTSITATSAVVWANRSSVGTVQVAYQILGK